MANSGLLDHMVVLFATFWGTSMIYWFEATNCLHDFHSHEQYTSISFSQHASQHLLSCIFLIFVVLNQGGSNGFALHLHVESWCWTSFHEPVGHFKSSFGKYLYLLPISKLGFHWHWGFFFPHSAYIPNTNPLLGIWFANTFSHS